LTNQPSMDHIQMDYGYINQSHLFQACLTTTSSIPSWSSGAVSLQSRLGGQLGCPSARIQFLSSGLGKRKLGEPAEGVLDRFKRTKLVATAPLQTRKSSTYLDLPLRRSWTTVHNRMPTSHLSHFYMTVLDTSWMS
jgi:hypothetical protein